MAPLGPHQALLFIGPGGVCQTVLSLCHTCHRRRVASIPQAKRDGVASRSSNVASCPARVPSPRRVPDRRSPGRPASSFEPRLPCHCRSEAYACPLPCVIASRVFSPASQSRSSQQCLPPALRMKYEIASPDRPWSPDAAERADRRSPQPSPQEPRPAVTAWRGQHLSLRSEGFAIVTKVPATAGTAAPCHDTAS